VKIAGGFLLVGHPLKRVSSLFTLDGLIVRSLSDAGDDCVASGVVGSGIGDENRERQAAAVRQRDQAEVIS
jgi:hypothetical protein